MPSCLAHHSGIQVHEDIITSRVNFILNNPAIVNALILAECRLLDNKESVTNIDLLREQNVSPFISLAECIGPRAAVKYILQFLAEFTNLLSQTSTYTAKQWWLWQNHYLNVYITNSLQAKHDKENGSFPNGAQLTFQRILKPLVPHKTFIKSVNEPINNRNADRKQRGSSNGANAERDQGLFDSTVPQTRKSTQSGSPSRTKSGHCLASNRRVHFREPVVSDSKWGYELDVCGAGGDTIQQSSHHLLDGDKVSSGLRPYKASQQFMLDISKNQQSGDLVSFKDFTGLRVGSFGDTKSGPQHSPLQTTLMQVVRQETGHTPASPTRLPNPPSSQVKKVGPGVVQMNLNRMGAMHDNISLNGCRNDDSNHPVPSIDQGRQAGNRISSTQQTVESSATEQSFSDKSSLSNRAVTNPYVINRQVTYPRTTPTTKGNIY